MLEVGFWWTLHYHDVELIASFKVTCVGLVAEWCWLCSGEWVPISGAGNSASFSPSGPSGFYPQPQPDVSGSRVSHKGSYGLSSVNKNNINTTLCSEVSFFLKPFSVSWSWRMLNVTNSYVNMCIIKCNPVHCISLSLSHSLPPSLVLCDWRMLGVTRVHLSFENGRKFRKTEVPFFSPRV